MKYIVDSLSSWFKVQIKNVHFLNNRLKLGANVAWTTYEATFLVVVKTRSSKGMN